jgi:hypothetical protein
MAKLLELTGQSGSVLFQAPAKSGEISAVSKTGEVIEKVATSIGQVLGMVGDIADGFKDAIKDAPVETAQLEFGLQFTASGRMYVVEAQAQAAITVTLTVTPREQPAEVTGEQKANS